VLVSLGLLLVSAGSARAAGLPLFGADIHPAHVGDRSFVYVAHPSAHSTVVQRRSRDGRSVKRVTLGGRFIVPVVAEDGSASGLSADGRTLVLARPRVTFPEPRTTIAVLDAQSLYTRRSIHLQGDYGFDAISPDGRWIYLVQYPQANPTKYRVRALDATTGQLRAQDVIDPHDRGEQMHGSPITRTASPDGRWAYTLYDAGFVHALDTAGLTARCINLPTGVDLNSAILQLDGPRLLVVSGGRQVASIDTSKFAPPVRTSAAGLGPVPIVALALLVITAAGLAVRRLMPARPVPGA
jgi:DNA-binding beta-propeller fold protein YncE